MATIRRDPPTMIECPACDKGVRIAEDARGKIPKPKKVLGSIYVNNPTVCPWCGGANRILDRKARDFEDALRSLNEHTAEE